MSELVRICSKAELPEVGLAKAFDAAGVELCIANVDGVLCALSNVCPHHGGPLAEGSIEEGHVVCPWHGWAFDPATGQSSHDANEKVEVYPLTIETEDVFVRLIQGSQ